MIFHFTAQEHHFLCQSISQVFRILGMYNFDFFFNNFKEGWDSKVLNQIVICETKSIFRNTILFKQDDPQKIQSSTTRATESAAIPALSFDISKLINITVKSMAEILRTKFQSCAQNS